MTVARSGQAPECPVYHPTLAEVNGMTFVEYVEKVEKQAAFREAGICKIVMPDGWAPRKTGYNRLTFDLPRWGAGWGERWRAAGRGGVRRRGARAGGMPRRVP